MKKWAVIGASSFSGKAFCRYLRDYHDAHGRGFHVEEYSRPFYDLNGNLGFFEDALLSQSPDYIVNFAALNMVAESWKHYADYYATNVMGVAKLVERIAKMKNVKRFIQVSTPEVYGAQHSFLAEDAPYNPSTPYAVSRAAIDMHLMAMHRAQAFPVSFTRSVNVYGPEQQPYRIIPKTVLKIVGGGKLELHGGGKSTRSFIHIDDVSESIFLVATRGRAGEVYHTSTKRQISIHDLVVKICKLMGVDPKKVIAPADERPGKDMAYQLHSDKIRSELGWSDRIELDAGLRATVEWFRENADHYSSSALEYHHRR